MIIWAVCSLIVASVFAGALTSAVKRVAFRRNWLGQAMPHHLHDGPVPRLGGISIFLTVFIFGSVLTFLPVASGIVLASGVFVIFLARQSRFRSRSLGRLQSDCSVGEGGLGSSCSSGSILGSLPD